MSDHELAPDFLTPAWLSGVIGHDVAEFGVRRIGDGLVGMNLRLVITFASPDEAASAGAPATVVAKLPSPDPTSRATGIALRNYEREVKFYRDLAGTLDIRVARCHHADWDEASGDFVLVLEDLAPGEQGNQLTGCTVDEATTSVLELAKLHGPRWNDPTLHDIEWLSRRTGPDDTQMLAGMWSMLLPGFMGTYAKYLSAEAQDLVTGFTERIGDWVDGRDGDWTVTHGDYRLDNLMFASRDGGYPVATVDWQSPGHSQSTGDVSYFMGAGLLPEQRRQVERGVVHDYGQALAGYGVDLDESWLWKHYCRDAYAGVIMSVVASQIVATTDRSESLFATMATRHTQHALDLDAASLL